MIHDSKFDILQERLLALVETGTLNAPANKQAQKLLARLQKPVKVAIVGPATAGRQLALNAIAECDLFPRPVNCPAVEMKYGKEDSTVATLASGERKTLSDQDAAHLPAETMLLSVTRSTPQLKRIEFLDLVTDHAPEDIGAALNWAARTADIFIWWSERFAREELSAWVSAPAKVKDHAFLVLCGRDRTALASRLRTGLSTEFLDVVAVDPTDASPTMSTGLADLTGGLRRHLHLGREADDAALQLFLRRFEGATEARIAGPGRAGQQPDRPVKPWQVAAGSLESVSDRAEDPVALQPAPQAPTLLSTELSRVCLARLRERGRDLRLRLEAEAEVDAIEHCLDTVRILIELADQDAETSGTGSSDLTDLLMSVEETLMLLSAERDETAIEDAVCCLLQLRREFEIGPHAFAEPQEPASAAMWAAQ